jgi:hypothetical protein
MASFLKTDAVAEVYQGFDLHGFNGDESDLPLAATYVIKME